MQKEDIHFHEITLKDKEWMEARFQETNLCACEFSFATNFLWRKTRRIEVAEYLGCGICHIYGEKDDYYLYPFGNGDRVGVIEKLWKICKIKNTKLRFYPIVEEQRKELLKHFRGKFEIDARRDDYDYIYTSEKLAYLRGKKLHSKRNHIARFCDTDDWSYEPLNIDNSNECFQMSMEWAKQRAEKWNQKMEDEMKALQEALSLFKELSLVGGVLRKAGKIVAFAIGEPLSSDTFDVRFEKAIPSLQGAYSMINQQFVLHEGMDFRYINREEDTGDAGLRKAKMSYYPDILLKKYCAVESDIVFALREEEEEIIELWEECFHDSREYIRFYLKNRFTEENMLVFHEDGKIVSMASFLPVEIRCREKYVEGRYVYAVATRKAYRNRGYARKILAYAKEKYKEPLILQAASEELKEFYQEIGFREISQKKEEERKIARYERALGAAEISTKTDITEPTPKRYKELRDAYFESEGYVKWSEDAVAYAIEENAFVGGKTIEKEHMILMYHIENKTLYITETTMNEKILEETCMEILHDVGGERVCFCNKGGMLYLPLELEKGQIGKDKRTGYLNLTLG